MQTFLPLPSFTDSAAALDDKRLGKQRVEAWQIATAFENGGGWSRHPATLMWRGWRPALLRYGLVVSLEWISRGHSDQMGEIPRRSPTRRETGPQGLDASVVRSVRLPRQPSLQPAQEGPGLVREVRVDGVFRPPVRLAESRLITLSPLSTAEGDRLMRTTRSQRKRRRVAMLVTDILVCRESARAWLAATPDVGHDNRERAEYWRAMARELSALLVRTTRRSSRSRVH